MKKLLLTTTVIVAFIHMALAGGIVTNTNQSCSFVRMLARDASVDIDAVFFNPAGLTMLKDGLYIQLNNQTITQSREIQNNYTYLNNHSFKGSTMVPFLPTMYLAYKKDKLVFNAGLTIIGGGGSADYDQGLPSFEATVANLVPMLSAPAVNIPTSKYSADIAFTGSSVYYGIQAGAAYKVCDYFSLGLGARYVMAKNTYVGHIKNIMINPNYAAFGAKYDGVAMNSAPGFFTDGKNFLAGLASGATGYSTIIGSKIGGGVASTTLLSDGTTNGLTPTEIGAIQQILGAAGLTPTQIGAIDVGTAQATLTGAAPVFTAKSQAMAGYAAMTSDKEVDVEQNGSGYTPIVSANFNLMDSKLNVAVKYEGITKMKVKNKTKIDGSGLFPNNAETASDIPALLTLGATYKIMDNFSASVGGHYYFDRSADYGKKDSISPTEVYTGNEHFIDKNSYEIAVGLEYGISEKLLLSCGYLYASTSPALVYQSEMSYTLCTQTFAFGGKYALSPRFDVELGILYTSYQNGEKELTKSPYLAPSKETYYKSTVLGSIGLTYRLFGE